MLPFEGIKVVDLTTWIFAPSCAAVLADWGADVIKIEDPETGDPFRWFMAVAGIDESDAPVSVFGLDNRNKKGMAIDLKQDQGVEIVRKLVEDTDIFITNLRRQAIERLKLDYPTLSAINPRLIYATASGYGCKGPDVDKPGFDATAFWARSGLMAGLAVEGQPPVAQPVAGIGDHASGLAMFGGISMALYNREKTGRGQKIDVSLMGVSTWVMGSGLQSTISLGWETLADVRKPRHEFVNPLANYYKAKDDKWLYLMLLPDEPYWPPLCRAMGREDLESNPKFHTRDDRLENNIELIRILDDVFAGKTMAEWTDLLDKHGLVWTHIPMTLEDVVNDPQVRANDHIVEADHPSFGPTEIITSPIRLNDTVPPIRDFAPEIGQHNEEILLDMGYSWETIEALKEKGVIP